MRPGIRIRDSGFVQANRPNVAGVASERSLRDSRATSAGVACTNPESRILIPVSIGFQ